MNPNTEDKDRSVVEMLVALGYAENKLRAESSRLTKEADLLQAMNSVLSKGAEWKDVKQVDLKDGHYVIRRPTQTSLCVAHWDADKPGVRGIGWTVVSGYLPPWGHSLEVCVPLPVEEKPEEPLFVLEQRFKPGVYFEWWGDECGGPYWTTDLSKAEKLTHERALYEKGMVRDETLVVPYTGPRPLKR